MTMAHLVVGVGEVVGGGEGEGGGAPHGAGRPGRSFDQSWGGLGAGRMA